MTCLPVTFDMLEAAIAAVLAMQSLFLVAYFGPSMWRDPS